MIRKVVLPAAGHGTRLRPLTYDIPKEMLPVGDRLVLHHVLAECRDAGFDRLLAVVSRAKGALVDAMERITAEDAGDALYPQVYYVYQRTQGGLAHAVMHAESFAGGEDIAVALADTIIWSGGETAPSLLSRMVAVHEARGAAATIAIQEVSVERVSRYGIVRPAEGADTSEVFPIVEVVEKPTPEAAPSRLAITARYLFAPAIFPALRALTPGPNGEIQLTDAITALARAGKPVLGVRLAPGERRLDIGNHDSYWEAWKLLALRQ